MNGLLSFGLAIGFLALITIVCGRCAVCCIPSSVDRGWDDIRFGA
jgi:hypothetical protein